jgi:hypothetical protein
LIPCRALGVVLAVLPAEVPLGSTVVQTPSVLAFTVSVLRARQTERRESGCAQVHDVRGGSGIQLALEPLRAFLFAQGSTYLLSFVQNAPSCLATRVIHTWTAEVPLAGDALLLRDVPVDIDSSPVDFLRNVRLNVGCGDLREYFGTEMIPGIPVRDRGTC